MHTKNKLNKILHTEVFSLSLFFRAWYKRGWRVESSFMSNSQGFILTHEIFNFSQLFIVNSSWGSSVGKDEGSSAPAGVVVRVWVVCSKFIYTLLCVQPHLHLRNVKLLFISRFVEENGGSSLESALIKYHLESQINPKIINKAPGWCQRRLFIKEKIT